ncbi:hypothetical protein CRYUN_Cryun30bG0023800 [Craigia yunnanensis]
MLVFKSICWNHPAFLFSLSRSLTMAQAEQLNNSLEIKEPSPKVPKLGQNGVHEVTQGPISLLRVKKLSEKAVLPSRGSPLAAGYDLSRSCFAYPSFWVAFSFRVIQIEGLVLAVSLKLLIVSLSRFARKTRRLKLVELIISLRCPREVNVDNNTVGWLREKNLSWVDIFEKIPDYVLDSFGIHSFGKL